MQAYARIASLVFGITMLALSATVTFETILRKLFSLSLGGVDELSGYAIAIGAPLAFAVALIEQSHIRINLLHLRMPRRLQGGLNAAAAMSLAALSVFLLVFTLQTVRDTQTYKSIAQTPWATPLIWPQSAWLLAMALFALPAVWMGLKALGLLLRGDTDALVQGFGPGSAEEELQAELEDLERR